MMCVCTCLCMWVEIRCAELIAGLYTVRAVEYRVVPEEKQCVCEMLCRVECRIVI